MNITIDDNFIHEDLGIDHAPNALLYEMRGMIDYLESNNKNYRKAQYDTICMLREIIYAMQ
jgi:hypothetical protein